MAIYDMYGNRVDAAAAAGGAVAPEPVSNIEVGSINTSTGKDADAVSRFRSGYIRVDPGALVRLTEFGESNGFGMNVYQYYTTSTYKDHTQFIGQRGYSTSEFSISNLNCAYIRLTIGKNGVTDVTGMESEFSQAVEIVPSTWKPYKSQYLFSKNLQTLERFFDSATDYNQTSVSAAEMITKFDALIDDHFTEIKAGQDAWGNTLKAYRWKPKPKGYLDYHVVMEGQFHYTPFPKIMVVGNIHGHERGPTFSMLKLVELLTSGIYVNDSIDFIRNNVEIIMVPLSNPSGWDDKSYENRAGQNLNRDFPPYGNSTQAETQFIESVFNDDKDGLCFFFDFHNCRYNGLYLDYNRNNTNPGMYQLGYVYTDNSMFQQMGMNIYAMLKTRVNDMSATPVDYLVYCESARKGTCAVWAQSQGVEGTLFEINKTIPALSGSTEFANQVIIWGVNLLCAFVCNSIYTLRLNN